MLLSDQYRSLSIHKRKSFICDTYICDTFICDKFWQQTEILVFGSDSTKVKLLRPQYRDQQSGFG